MTAGQQRKTKQKLDMAIIGVGGMGAGHAQSIKRRVPEARLVAVCDGDPARAEEMGKTFRVPAFTHERDLIRSGCCRAVLIASPHPHHYRAAIACMKAGLHVLCEKPLTERISTADKMVRAAARANVAFGVMFQRRFEPGFFEAIDLVRKGFLGELRRATMLSPEFRTQAYYNMGSWRATWEGEGGGVMLNQAPHVIDLFIQLAGMPKRVRGRTATALHAIEVEDLAEATLEYANGASGYLYCSTNEPAPGQMIELFGDKGKITFRDGHWAFVRYTGGGVARYARTTREVWGSPGTEAVAVRIRKRAWGHFLVIRNFARHILYREALLTPGASGLHSLELANAITLSSHTGKAVNLPLNRAAYDRLLKSLIAASPSRKTARKQRATGRQHAK
jgi:predicted dehydrogenase